MNSYNNLWAGLSKVNDETERLDSLKKKERECHLHNLNSRNDKMVLNSSVKKTIKFSDEDNVISNKVKFDQEN